MDLPNQVPDAELVDALGSIDSRRLGELSNRVNTIPAGANSILQPGRHQ